MRRPLGSPPALAALAGLLAAVLSGCGGPQRPPNLLVLSVDTLRADALAHAGNPEVATPHLDRLAAEGTRFTQAIAPIPRTTPALASLLTGLWPHRHGSREVGSAIFPPVMTLAELLHGRGYATLAVSANASAGPRQGLDQGFDRYVTYEQIVERHSPHLYHELDREPAEPVGWAEAVNREGLRLLEAANPGRPFFLWLFYFDPHFVYRPPPPWQEGVEAAGCHDLYERYRRGEHRGGEVFADVGGIASEVVDDCRSLYLAEVAYTDHQVGAFLKVLEERGLLENTVVVFTSDHGENLGEGGLYFEHGDNAHDAGLRVPLIFRGPGIAAGRVDRGAVSLVDVVPTVLGLLGVPEDSRPPVDGLDLSPRLAAGALSAEASEPEPRVVFAESATAMWNEATDYLATGVSWGRMCINGERFSLCEVPSRQPGVYALYDHEADPLLTRNVAEEHPEVLAELLAAWRHWPPESARERVARTPRFKLVQRPRLDGGYDSRLYDLERDPAESLDVRGEHPEVYRDLRARLEAWAAEIPRPAPREVDPELEETLRALGYLG